MTPIKLPAYPSVGLEHVHYRDYPGGILKGPRARARRPYLKLARIGPVLRLQAYQRRLLRRLKGMLRINDPTYIIEWLLP